MAMLINLTPQVAYSDAKSYCSPIVKRAIDRESPNEIEMMRAGEKASSECFRDYYRNNSVEKPLPMDYNAIKNKYDEEQSAKKSEIFGEKTIGEAVGAFIGYLIAGILISLIPGVGMFIGIPMILVGMVILGYTLMRLYYGLFIVLAIVAAVFIVITSFIVIRDSFKVSDWEREEKEKEKEKELVVKANIAMASRGDTKGLLLKCISKGEYSEFVKYLEKLDTNEFVEISPILVAETLKELGKSKYLELLLKKGFNADNSADMIFTVLQPLNLTSLKVMGKHGVDFNSCDLSVYIDMVGQNLKKTRTKGRSPVMKKAEDGLKLILKNLNPDRAELLHRGLEGALKSELGDNYKFVEKLFPM